MSIIAEFFLELGIVYTKVGEKIKTYFYIY